jgi:hypothetical protein
MIDFVGWRPMTGGTSHISRHTKLQMQRRGVAVEDIRTVLANPHTSYPGTNLKGDTVVKWV